MSDICAYRGELSYHTITVPDEWNAAWKCGISNQQFVVISIHETSKFRIPLPLYGRSTGG